MPGFPFCVRDEKTVTASQTFFCRPRAQTGSGLKLAARSMQRRRHGVGSIIYCRGCVRLPREGRAGPLAHGGSRRVLCSFCFLGPMGDAPRVKTATPRGASWGINFLLPSPIYYCTIVVMSTPSLFTRTGRPREADADPDTLQASFGFLYRQLRQLLGFEG